MVCGKMCISNFKQFKTSVKNKNVCLIESFYVRIEIPFAHILGSYSKTQ